MAVPGHEPPTHDSGINPGNLRSPPCMVIEPSPRRHMEAAVSKPSRLTPRAFSRRSLPRGARRRTYVGILIATTTLCFSGAAHSGPCTGQIAQLERQIQLAASSPASGPTALQSIMALLHHQPTPDRVQNAERKANLDATVVLDRARQADLDGRAVACTKALDEAKHHWVIPPLS
jgi:3',5'-cyclic AMP phosphodiesterase CpdA